MLGVGSVSVLVGGMAALDETVRGALFGLFNGQLPIAISVPDLRIQDMPRMLTGALGLPTGAQLPFLGFGLVGVVLVVLMFRS
jgi:hypothetical protein